MTISCIAVDDEPLALRLMDDHISKVPFLKLKGTFSNPLEALVALGKLSPDIIFLDIQMPELNGIDFMSIVNNRSKIIITSAYPEYAIEGYEHNVVDYLLKPVSFQRFYKAVEKVRNTMFPPTNGAPHTAEQAGLQPTSGGYIFVKVENKLVRVELDDILYIEGLKNYVYIYTSKGRILSLQVMKQLEETLPSHRYFRVHKSYIIAINKINTVEKQHVIINGETIPIGATYAEKFFKALEGLKG